MRLIPHGDLVATPWANNGGITREIAAQHDDDGLLWRISLADVRSEGPFSPFHGLHRVLTVVNGKGMMLECADAPMVAAPLTPVSFAGDLPVTGQLPRGPVRNLNLIFRRDRISASVTARSGPGEIAPLGEPALVFLVSGTARIGARDLAPLTSVIGASEPIVLARNASAVCIALGREGR